MTTFNQRTLLAAAIGVLLGLGTIADAQAQYTSERNERYKENQGEEQQEGEVEAKYPAATREEPETKVSGDLAEEANAMISAYNDEKFAEARAKAAELLAEEEANAYEKSLAAQIDAHAAYDLDKVDEAIASLQKAIELDGLGNNAHYSSMKLLAQLQLQEGMDQQGLATLDRFIIETGGNDADALILKGNTLYNMERYQEAAAATQKAIDASPEPDPSWVQLLMGIYFELDQPQKAAQIAEQLAAKNPGDKRAQLNLASIYLQGGQDAKAAATLEKLRTSGQMTEADDYRQLYATYLNMEGKESEAIAVIQDGLAKGVLQPSHEVYVAMAQSYYYTGNDAKAIEAYQKAAPLDENGETYLNLARVLWSAGRIGEAKQAAQNALDKGVQDRDDAQEILALPGG